MALTDYTWATVNGTLRMNCTIGNKTFSSGAERAHNPTIDRGFEAPETSDNLQWPSCKKIMASQVRLARPASSKTATLTDCACARVLWCPTRASAAYQWNQALQ
mmetsp:Transcript_12827/g.29260  ORF Transcript_12827/g.29260 Transcript_12827/m.29260 type:complete len:104 (-) Transcript_12827:3-314(-)